MESVNQAPNFFEVNVIADSISEDNYRLTTLECIYPRFIHSEFMTHREFCLDGDSILEFDLPAGSTKSKYRSYKMTIKDFVTKWHLGAAKHKSPNRKAIQVSLIVDDQIYTAKELAVLLRLGVSNIRLICRKGKLKVQNPSKARHEDYKILGKDFKAYRTNPFNRTFSIQSRLKKMKIRQLNEDTGLIQHSYVVNCYVSGMKEVFKVTAGNFSVAGSQDHRILTADGWKPIKDLQIGIDRIIVQKAGIVEDQKSDGQRFKKVNGKWRVTWQQKIRKAYIKANGLICEECKNSVTSLEVHHKIPVHQDISLTFTKLNVVVICRDCHNKKHVKQGWQNSLYLYGLPVIVDKIESLGEKETYDLEIAGEYPNFLANNIVVHNSRNASSSRAIPVKVMIERVQQCPAVPQYWGETQRGMQADGEISEENKVAAIAIWKEAMLDAVRHAERLTALRVHKQIANRVLEPYSYIKVLISSTNWHHFLALREHKDAQPEIQILAKLMHQRLHDSIPVLLAEGQYHTPYADDSIIDLETRIKVSVARCARVSYFNPLGNQDTYKDIELHDRLFASKHMSPFEHVATPKKDAALSNFTGWHQYRKDLKGEYFNPSSPYY